MKADLVDRKNSEVVYDGPIRGGGAGSPNVDGYTVKRDTVTGLVFLDPVPPEVKKFYENPDYWAGRYGDKQNIDFGAMYRKLDGEQARWLYEVGFNTVRDKNVADFGAGAGLFLDSISRIAERTVAVEPTTVLKLKLESAGHDYFQYSHEVPSESLDVVVSFDTLEHTLRPDEFLADVFKALKPGGRAIIGVPNQDDFLKQLCQDYLPFFYHKSHLFFFSGKTLSMLAVGAGFRILETRYVHKYDLNNMVVWLRDSKGVGKQGCNTFDEASEHSFRANLERQGISSHVMVFLGKP